MPLYSQTSRLKDVIFTDPQVIPVINRLGVSLGVGDLSIAEVCRRHDVDPGFFLLIVNTFLNEDYFPETPEASRWLDDACRYLDSTCRYYERVQLPNIERHLNLLIDRSGDAGNLLMLRTFFMEVKTEFLSVGSNLSGASDVFDSVEEKIDDLLSFFVIHLEGDYDRNLCVAVVTSIFALQKDMRQNNRIRRRLFGSNSRSATSRHLP